MQLRYERKTCFVIVFDCDCPPSYNEDPKEEASPAQKIPQLCAPAQGIREMSATVQFTALQPRSCRSRTGSQLPVPVIIVLWKLAETALFPISPAGSGKATANVCTIIPGGSAKSNNGMPFFMARFPDSWIRQATESCGEK